MKKIILMFLCCLVIGVCDVKSQVNEVILGDGIIVLEKLSSSQSDDLKVKVLRTAQKEGKISNTWKVGDFRTGDRRLQKDYVTIENGLKKRGKRFKELNQPDFAAHLNELDPATFYLTTDYSVREDGNFLVITRTFKLFTADTVILSNESAKGILKCVK
jgi:hypothetical protein